MWNHINNDRIFDIWSVFYGQFDEILAFRIDVVPQVIRHTIFVHLNVKMQSKLQIPDEPITRYKPLKSSFDYGKLIYCNRVMPWFLIPVDLFWGFGTLIDIKRMNLFTRLWE